MRCGSLPPIDEPPAAIPLEPAEFGEAAQPVPASRITMTMRRNTETYRLFFGDLHRHTSISRCSPTIDGGLQDAYRYALDVAEYDFLAITNHTRDVDPFSWWRTQKACDLFHAPGRFVPIYGYERSNRVMGGGHRNVFFLGRGHEVNPGEAWYSGRNLPVADRDPDTTLYPWLREREALTAAHTPEWSADAMKGTWTFSDPQVEPVAEIFQAFRRSYERPGARVSEQASLWYALRSGHRLGFIASSDHISTHMSYACVWAQDKSRKSIFEALQARRTYAATDRIGLDVRIGDALMGEETTLPQPRATLRIRAVGTSPIRELEVVRSGRVIHTIRPDRQQIDVEFTDPDAVSGEAWYYVRLLQSDDAIAWGSPCHCECCGCASSGGVSCASGSSPSASVRRARRQSKRHM